MIGQTCTCEQCGRSFVKRSGREPRYCSTACRMRAYRRRLGAVARRRTTGGRVVREVRDAGDCYRVRCYDNRPPFVVRKRGSPASS